MWNRIKTRWTWARGAYLIVGAWMILQSALEGQWIGIMLGSLLAVMGLFGLGCAAGTCFNDSCNAKPDGNHKP